MRNWTVGSLDDRALHEMQNALHGNDYSMGPIPGDCFDTLPIAKQLLALRSDQHQKLLVACKREIAQKTDWDYAPNLDCLRKKYVTYTETESSGLFGLKKKTITKEKYIENPDYKKIDDYLNGESFILIRSERSAEEGDNYCLEHDNATLLTESGRYVNAVYSVLSAPNFDTNIESVQEIDQLDEKTNTLTAAQISRYLGLEKFQSLLI